MNPVSGVYRLRHLASGRIYVGSAVNIKRRLAVHMSMLRRGMHKNAHLQNAWNKYGIEAFTSDVLLLCSVENLLSCT